MLLIRPTHKHLASYISALEKGWSWDNSRPAAADDELDMIRANAGAFLASMDDPEAKGLQSLYPMVPLSRGCLEFGAGCGMVNLLEISALGGNTEQLRFHLHALAT